jgi:ribosomal protein L7Ae-like RNA K-turn-binding protein
MSADSRADCFATVGAREPGAVAISEGTEKIGDQMSNALIATLLEDGSLTLHVGDSFKTPSVRGAFVRSVYAKLRNDAASVIVLAHDAPANVVEALQEAAKDTDVSVMVSAETYEKGKRKGQRKNAIDLYKAIAAKNAATASEGTETFGTCAFSDPLLHDAENAETLYGFSVNRVS